MGQSLKGCRVLVAEDEAVAAWLLETVLRRAGCEIIGPLGTLREALLRARAGGLDAALLDVNLCGEHVYPVADALATHQIPFVFVTGYRASALPLRFQDRPLCQKPCAETAPITALRHVL